MAVQGDGNVLQVVRVVRPRPPVIFFLTLPLFFSSNSNPVFSFQNVHFGVAKLVLPAR